MAKISELVDDIADIMNEPRETVNAYARALIDDGLLPKSRGRAIATAEPIHVIRLFVATALAPKIKDTSAVVTKYCDLIPGGIPESHPRYEDAERAGDVLASILQALMSEAGGDRANLREATIEIVETWPEINITFPDGGIARYTQSGNPGEHWSGYTKRSAIISGRAFVFLGFGNGRDYFEVATQ